MYFRMYSIRDNQLKKRKKQKHQPPVEAAVGRTQPPFQVVAAARQPAATVANLQPFVVAAGTYHQVLGRSLAPLQTAVGTQLQFETAVQSYFYQC
jgi:hypothetical protein